MISSDVILRDAIASAQMCTLSSCLLSLQARPVQDVGCSFLWDDMLLTPGSGIETEASLELALSDMSPCGNDCECPSTETPDGQTEGILKPPMGTIGMGVCTCC